MADIQSRIPPSYQEAVVRCVLPVCTASGRIAFAFDTADGQTLRLSVPLAQAEWMTSSLLAYMSEAARTQSPGSALIPCWATLQAKQAEAQAALLDMQAASMPCPIRRALLQAQSSLASLRAEQVRGLLQSSTSHREEVSGVTAVAQMVIDLLPDGRVRMKSTRLGQFDALYAPLPDERLPQELAKLMVELRQVVAGVTPL